MSVRGLIGRAFGQDGSDAPKPDASSQSLIVIEKGVPIPPSRGGSGRGARIYPLATMAVGDSFYVGIRQDKIGGSLYRQSRRIGIKISTRTEGEGCRVWRVE